MAKGKRLVFRKDEIPRVKSLISFNFDKFNLCAKDYLPEKLLLYKACRIFEQELIDALAIRPQNSDEELERSNTLQAIYLQLGHVNLLAQDYARALSAYQKAYGYNKKDFWKDASGLYGLGLAYLHFRAFRPAIDAFCRLLFCHPYVDVATEVHARLGVAYKCLEEFSQSLKHLLIALDDAKELPLIPRYELRFHIAHCYDGFRDFRRAVEEYRRLLADHERAQFRLPISLLSAVFRQLGWISLRSRENEPKEEIRAQKLKEAEQLLCKARDLTPTDSRTNCYLGLCYSEQTLPPPPSSSTLVSSSRGGSVAPQQQRPSSACANNSVNSSNQVGRLLITAASASNSSGGGNLALTNANNSNLTDNNGRVAPSDQHQLHQQLVAADRAQDAFVSYRSAIDSDESDANNWCSIGVLYQQQNQPIDALQTFACAVQLDEKHSASWTELGRLYESHRQFHESLYCYRRALQHNPAVPESLKARVLVLEKEFSSAPGGHAGAAAAAQTHQQQLLKQQQQQVAAGTTATTSALNRLQVLPSLENAWHLGIPAQVRQRLGDFYKQQQNRYREGSPLWTMSELAAHAMRQPFYELDPTQRQIMRVLKLNKERLEQNELRLLRQLEDHYNALVGNNNSNKMSNNNKNDKEEVTATTVERKVEAEKDVGLALQPHEELKLRISRTTGVVSRTAAGDENATAASTTTTDFPCISQDDLEDVLGGSIVAEQQVSSSAQETTRQFLDADRKSVKHSAKKSPLTTLDEKKRKRRKKRHHDDAMEENDYLDDARHGHSPRGCSVVSSASSSVGEQRSLASSSMALRNSDIFDAELEEDVEEEQSAGISAVQLHAERVVCTSFSASSPSTSNSELLPPAFSMLARVHVPVTVSSAEILEMCKKRRLTPHDYRPIFDEHCPPPQPPVRPPRRPTREGLLLRIPWIIVDSARDAATSELQNFCYNAPIALVHGLTAALKIDLSQFSTKSLIQTAPDHEVEVRTQYKMPGDVNLDGLGNPTWACHSTKSFTTIGRYGQYQAESFRHSLKEETEKLKLCGSNAISCTGTRQPNNENDVPTVENGAPLSKRRRVPGGASSTATTNDADSSNTGSNSGGAHHFKTIKFGTNVDLSDERKFHAQLHELNKMPAFCRISAACNMLTHLGYTVLGMNTVQLYMKVPGCRTPGHLENNSFASVNINIGPGECEWFGVPYEYWPVIERMCKQRGIDFLKGAWWPSFQDLVDAEVPCYRFTQKAGDMVWVGGGCVHWVQATGWCNNVAWNVGPISVNQLEMALMAHEWNRLNTYRSLVPMQHLAWQLARSVRFSNQQVFNIVKQILIRSLAYCRMIADYVEHSAKSAIKPQLREKGEAAHYCHLCEIEVFNILFVKEVAGKFRVFCVQCARKNHIDDYVVLQEIPFDELAAVFDRLQLHPSKSALVC